MTDSVKNESPAGNASAATNESPATSASRSSGGRRALVVVAAAVIAVLVWMLLDPVGNVHLAIGGSGSSEQHITAVAVVLTAVVVGLVAWALLAGLERAVRRAHLVWRVTAVVVLVLSLLGPLSGTSMGAKLGLACLHLCVGAVLIVGLSGWSARLTRPVPPMLIPAATCDDVAAGTPLQAGGLRGPRPFAAAPATAGAGRPQARRHPRWSMFRPRR